MGASAPQWLPGAFVDAMQQVGATAPTERLTAEARDLIERWSAPERHVHNLRHLVDVLTHIDEIASTAHDPDVLRIAAWYHGAFLNKALEIKWAGVDCSTTRCIDHAHNRLTDLGVSEDVVARIDELIAFLMRHRAPRDDLDAQVLVDANHAMLAASPQEYKKHRENLRLELADLDDPTYYRARRAFIVKLLALDAIYLSPLGDSWESSTRANLEVELARINERLGALSEDGGLDGDSTADDDEDDAPEEVTSTGTIIIKRRALKKNPCPVADDAPMPTGALPVLAPIAPQAPEAQSGETASSLESAIESMDLPGGSAS
ncbi:hypothetical protein M3T53_00625 [Actinomyces sp. B33]|uniref:HD domain-containing protein n=1 Tax=Actinomyces sp. B33 TaxID=2942131 RepID=UPI0023425026|nr:hypothetical protein [Actinomyces sp. B33]MDC4232222.1 hypothetical protein [Actinomyces sp. B33]